MTLTAQEFFSRALLLSYISILFALLTGLYKIKAMNKEQSLLFILIFLVSVTEITGRVLWKYSLNNLFLYHFYSVAEFLLLTTIYSRHLSGVVKPVYMKALMVAFVLFAMGNTIFFQSLSQFNSNVTFTESLLLIVMALLYFYKLLNALEYRKLEYVPVFWINLSILMYFPASLVLFHVANDLIPEPLKATGAIWGTHALFNIVHYLLYAIALWVKPENSEYTMRKSKL